MFPLTVNNEEATFAVIYMTVDAQLRVRHMEDFYDKLLPSLHFLLPTPSLPPPKARD